MGGPGEMRERARRVAAHGMGGCLYALGFLSRLPVPWDPIERSGFDRRGLAVFFPAAGLALGALFAALAAFNALWATPMVGAFLLVGAMPAVTGAFHEDGFADVADACGAYDRAKRLEVMKDSRIGSFGGLALAAACLGRFAGFTELLRAGPGIACAAIFLISGWSRWLPIVLLRALPYVSQEGRIAGEFDPPGARALAGWALALMVGTVLLLGPGAAAVAPLALLASSVPLARFFHASFGGITGDCLGAAAIVAELALLALAASFWAAAG